MTVDFVVLTHIDMSQCQCSGYTTKLKNLNEEGRWCWNSGSQELNAQYVEKPDRPIQGRAQS